ncbi:MAG: hypothetical protein VX231_08500 [Pseudomonadota bacterium]|nr:hypothetical protein [Pseudomonadota bacterium]
MKKIFTLLVMIPFILTASLASADEKSINWRDYDKDNNKKLSIEEFSQLRITQYTALDINQDGSWSRREFVKRSDNMSIGRKDALRQKFKRWDNNNDGQLSSEEVSRLIAGNFRWLDKNRSQSISLKEMPKQF